MPPDLNELCVEFILLNDENKSDCDICTSLVQTFENLIKIT